MTDQFTVKREFCGSLFSYAITWNESFSQLPGVISGTSRNAGKICIVSDANVAALYIQEVIEAIKILPAKIYVYAIPAGESSKNLDSVRSLYTYLSDNRFSRNDLILALGGGVVGDLAGFAAATYMRGIDFIQIPTTLLAQVDSSVGGKTAVDLNGSKNMVGAFHQPRAVYMNCSTLQTLPEREFLAGMGEVLKTALLDSRAFFEYLIKERERILSFDPEALGEIVRRCCAYKADIVARDPEERTDVRAVLNLGHTIGHAIEKCMDLAWPHGYCVAAGTVGAAFLSQMRGLLSADDVEQIRSGIASYGLPCGFDGVTDDQLLSAMRSDKKRTGSLHRFVLLQAIGSPVVAADVTDDEVCDTVGYLRKEASGDAE